MPRSPIPGLAPLVGAWRLESLVLSFSDTGEREEPYGRNPDGYMVLEPSGRIMFLFTKPNRSAPASESDRARLFNDMTAYTGVVRLDGPGRFVTTVDLAWNPAGSSSGQQLLFLNWKASASQSERPNKPIRVGGNGGSSGIWFGYESDAPAELRGSKILEFCTGGREKIGVFMGNGLASRGFTNVQGARAQRIGRRSRHRAVWR